MTELCITNLAAVLKAAGSGIEKVVKVNVFLTSMDNFAEMNATVRPAGPPSAFYVSCRIVAILTSVVVIV